MINQKDVDCLFNTVNDYLKYDDEFLLKEFVERFKFAATMEVHFKNNSSELYKRVQAKTVVLSELWYCFELFKPIAAFGFGTIKRKSSEQSNKEWLDAQRVSVHGAIEAEKIRKKNLFYNVDYSYNPFGNASLFDESYFSNKWFYDCYNGFFSDFSLISNDFLYMSYALQVSTLSHYLDALQLHSQGEQKIFLARGFNALIGASAAGVTSEDVLSFIYALRCNYVHQGELPDSLQMPVEYKEWIVDECTKYLICYCSLVYLTIIDELYLS